MLALSSKCVPFLAFCIFVGEKTFAVLLLMSMALKFPCILFGHREFGNQAPVQAPSSRRDRSGSNLSNADSSTAAAVAAQLAVDGSGASSVSNQVSNRATGATGASTIPLGE